MNRRKSESIWAGYLSDRTKEIERQHKRGTVEAMILGLVVFLAGAYLLCEPLAYAVARLWK